jgi:predicted HTH transcriptional regulator
MNWDTLIDVMKNGENNTIKFFGNSTLNHELGEAIVAMANTKGGQIYLGIDINNYHLYGFNDSEKEVMKFLSDHCRPALTFNIASIDKSGKKIVVLDIKETEDKPYYFNDICYVMEGSTIRRAFIEKNSFPLSKSPPKPKHSFDLNNSEPPLINVKIDVKEPMNQTQSKPSHSNPLNKRQSEALEYVKIEGSIKNREYRDLFSVSHKTAHLELVDMVERGLINSSGQGRSTHYICPNGY